MWIKAAPYVVCVGLLIGLLLYRGNSIKAGAELTAAKTANESLTKLNNENVEQLKQINRRQARDTAIQEQLAANIQSITDNQNQTNSNLDKAYASDPIANDWANEHVPDSVRATLETGISP